jgi:hypothetical protein
LQHPHRYHCCPSPCAGLFPARSTAAAPSRPGRSANGGPSPATMLEAQGRAGQGRFPCSLRFAHRRRSPALPQRPRCKCAAGLPRSLPVTGFTTPGSSSLFTTAGRCAPRPAQIHQVRASTSVEGVMTPVPRVLLSGPLTRHTPSGSTGPPWLVRSAPTPCEVPNWRTVPDLNFYSWHSCSSACPTC